MRLRRHRRALSGLDPGLLPALSAAALACVAACSTIDRDPKSECEADADCGAGFLCLLAQGNICVPAQPPPRSVLGFGIEFTAEEDQLSLELRGCDPEITREVQGTELRVQKRSSLLERYQLRASEVESVLDNCGGDSCDGGVCDEQELTCTRQADALLGLSMSSRLGLPDLASPQKSYVTVTEPPLPEGELPPAVAFSWPIYETSADSEHPALRLQVSPAPEVPKRSQYWRVLADDAPFFDAEDPATIIDSAGLVRCQRALLGNEGTVRTLAGSPIGEANVEFLYDEAIATAGTVIGTPPACTNDADCRQGWACDLDAGTCGLDMRGLLAGSSASLLDVPGFLAPAYLYTYCEGVVASVDPLYRQFRVRVTPPASLGLPVVTHSLIQGFLDPLLNGSPEVNLEDVDGGTGLCLPNWAEPRLVDFAVHGEPVALTQTDLGVYSCCSTECLPSPEPDIEPSPPPVVESCQAFERARFETRWVIDEQEQSAWADAGCIPPATHSDGSNGGYVRDISECDEQGCSVGLTPGNLDLDEGRDYTVTIVQPQGSVFRSQSFAVTVDSLTNDLPTFELEPRVLVRGQVSCVSDDCNATKAVIAAERLRADTDEADLPGPFYFETRVDGSGAFVLPVDPGLYVLTAYPSVGQPGAPSPYRVVDLRPGSPLLTAVDGVPNAILSDPFELDDGVLVRVQLRDFPVSTKVTPIDTGSWAAQSDFPEDLDLNDPLACLGSSTRGCIVRRVRPTDTPIPLLITGSFEFTTRARGAVDCPG